MANGIADLGNNLGYIYVTNPVSSPADTDIVASIPNTIEGARQAKLLSAQAFSASINKRAYGIITIGAVSGSGTITAVTIDSRNQINANISYTGATTTTDLAGLIRDGINNFAETAGTTDYTAISINNKVYVYASIDAGATVNGEAITVSNTGNLTVSTTDINYGSNNTTVYDQSTGFRFYLNADYDTSCDCAGVGTAEPGSLTNAIEITKYIVMRGLNMAIPATTATIASGNISLTRTAAIMYAEVDTQSAAATDDLDNIFYSDAADGDILIVRGTNSGRVITITSSGNLDTAAAWDSAGEDTSIMFRYEGGSWYEIARSGGNYVPSVSAFRTALFPFSSANGRTTSAPADNTTLTLTANSSDVYRRISGSATLSTGNYVVSLSVTGAVEGDMFVIDYHGTVTVGAYDVIIGGVTLTDEEALYGGVTLSFVYDSGSGSFLEVGRSYDLGVYPVQTANIGDGQVTVAKVESNLQYGLIVADVSFATGSLGDYKIKIPFDCTINEIYARATSAIAATDDATITPKNNGGTTLTDGVITFTASDAFGTAYTSTPSANNTFSAGDLLTLTTAKTTAGGTAQLSIKYTKT